MSTSAGEDIVMWSGGQTFRIPSELVQKLGDAGFAVGEVNASRFKIPFTSDWQTTKGLKCLVDGYQVMQPVLELLDDAQRINYETRLERRADSAAS
jgi:hypothetical protein